MDAPTAFGDRAWLLEVGDAGQAARVAEELRASLGDAVDVVSGFTSVVVVHDGTMPAAALGAGGDGVAAAVGSSKEHVLDVVLDGIDLAEVSQRIGVSPATISTELTRVTLAVAVVGFSPGFGYLTGLTGPLAELPRRETPRPRVPAGSVAVAAGMAAVYPQATPGGWWLLGRSDAVLFDVHRPSPSLLRPGDTVRFRPVTRLPERSGATPAPAGHPRRRGPRAALRVHEAPPASGVVDDGRRQVAHLGVPRGGPADPERSWLARALVGGGPSSIELAGAGCTLEVLDHVVVALVDLTGTVDGRRVPPGVPIGLRAGQWLSIDGVGRGQRGYLGVSGGVFIEPVLGSMSTDALAQIGPGFLAAGDVLGAGSVPTSVPTSGRLDADGSPVVLRYLPGPHVQLTGTLDGARATRSATSSKVGTAFDLLGGPLAVNEGTIASMPVVTGTIQVPPDGRPVVLGPDHATLGGYPIAGVVITADLGRLARLDLGDEVIFVAVDLDEARHAEHELAARLRHVLGARGAATND